MDKETINQLLADGVISQEVAEKYFPELKESEDEEIRKYLVNFVELNKEVNLPPEDADKMLAWLEKQGAQKPVVWSDEDEEMLKSIKYHLDCDNADIRCYGWLEELKDRVQPQPKQEWSEKDSQMYGHVLAVVSSSEDIDMGKKVEMINWLKSLRPQKQWKPSDEQINELKKVFDNEHGGWEDSIIESLYNELKKL